MRNIALRAATAGVATLCLIGACSKNEEQPPPADRRRLRNGRRAADSQIAGRADCNRLIYRQADNREQHIGARRRDAIARGSQHIHRSNA